MMKRVRPRDDFFVQKLGSPRYVCAPMVRGSERAFREVVRRHGVHVCWGPMVRAEELATGLDKATSESEIEQVEQITGVDICEDEQGLVIGQLGGRDPETMLKAAKHMMKRGAVAIDVNLGCPQDCARRGGFGAFLLQEPDTAVELVRYLAENLTVPVLCKIRVFEVAEDTIRFSKRLEGAGCAILTVHGRTRKVKHDGPVDFAQIARIAEALSIPVLANGGIYCKQDGERVLAEYPAIRGIMLASGLLANPRMLTCPERSWTLQEAIDFAFEYLCAAEKFPPPNFLYLQLHLRHMFRGFLRKDHFRWFNMLYRVYMDSVWHMMCFLRLLAIEFQLQPPDLSLSQQSSRQVLGSLADLRRGFVPSQDPQDEDADLGLFALSSPDSY